MDVPRTPSYNELELVTPGAPIIRRRNPNLGQMGNLLQPRRLFLDNYNIADEKIAKQKAKI